MKHSNFARLVLGLIVTGYLAMGCSSKQTMQASHPAITPSNSAVDMKPAPASLVAENSSNLGAASSGNSR